MFSGTASGPNTSSPSQPGQDSSSSRPLPKMQRFTRPEDLADLEDMGVREPSLVVTSTAPGTSTAAGSRNATRSRSGSTANRLGGLDQDTEQERVKRYIETHTTFLNSADTESSGYIPGPVTSSLFARSQDIRHMNDDVGSPLLSSSTHSNPPRTPIHYPSSLLGDDEGYTAPGSPHSFLSSPSLGYYSHPSRPLSRTGFWVDQGASSLNLIMPSSAMFLKIREPTPEGDKLGFVKLMVAGKSRVWHSRLIQDIFKWDGIIANDFEDEFLQGNHPSLSNEGITAADVAEHRHIQDAYTVHAAHDLGSSHSSAQQDESPQERRQERYHGVTETIVERYASSMVLPAWARSGLDGQELQQEILVKNICFVDTPGYSSFRNHSRAMDLAVSYLGLQFQTTNEFFSKSAASDDSLGRFLANNATGAHSHVDLCLYIIEGQLSDQDIVFMQRLQPWVNLVPILIPLDAPTHGSDPVMPHTTSIDVTTARQELIRQLRENNIEVYGVDDEVSRTVSSAGVSGEDDLSPPPLSLDGHSLYNEYTCPPFVFYVPKDVVQGSSSEASLEHGDIKIPVPVAHASSSSLDLRHEPLPDLSALRRWVFVDNLAALRHLTTLKFLRWRRHAHPMIPSPMYSSQESGSLRPRQHFLDDQSSASDHMVGSLKAPFPAAAANNHLLPTTGPPPPHQQSSPTEAMGHLISQDRRRITENVVKMLETHRQVFERIMLERQETWRLALEGMEREQRIDFLVQELKRCAMSGHSMPDNDQSLGETELSSSSRGHVVGLGMEAGISMNSEPSLRDALGQPLPSTLHLGHNRTHYRVTPHRSSRGKKNMSSGERSSPNWPRSTRHAQDRDAIDELNGDDPLGLGMWMGQLFRAIGRGIIQVVVMVGMGSFATWIYRHYLENNPMWIGQ